MTAVNLGAALIALLLVAQLNAQPPTSTNKRLNVVIIAVEDFDDPQYQNALLQTNIHDAAIGLEQFFQANFPAATRTVLRTHDETTIANLTEFFRGTFPGLVNGNMTLLFILSHGEALPAPNPEYGSDLRILASDTPASNLAGKTLSLSTDIIGNMQGLLPGSFLFGFVDTCHSGAAKSIGLSVDAALKNALGTKMMLMASSLSDQLAFQASFSRALLKIWNTPQSTLTANQAPCTSPEVSPSIIHKQIQDLLGADFALGPNDGYPTVLLHFSGAICLETFAAQSAIVELINGTADSYVASFTDPAGHELQQPIEARDSVPIRLNRTPYKLAVFRQNQQVLAKLVDLGMETFHWEILGYPEPHQYGVGLERGAAAAESVGAEKKDVAAGYQASYTAYTIAKDQPSAERVGFKIGDVIKAAINVSFPTMDQIMNALWRKDFITGPESRADAAQATGDLKKAAALYAEAASRTKLLKSNPQLLATKAYLDYIAAGEFGKAKEVRETYKLSPQSVCRECKNLEAEAVKGNAISSQVFANVATGKVLANVGTDMRQATVAAVPIQ